MGKATFYPIGNADTCLLQLNNGMVFFFDYADVHVPEEQGDKRMPLAKNFKEDLRLAQAQLRRWGRLHPRRHRPPEGGIRDFLAGTRGEIPGH